MMPSRFESQQEAVNMLCEAKTGMNPETTCGIMSSAGVRPEIQITQSKDIGRLMAAIHSVQIQGFSDIHTSIKIAQLSLKHRQLQHQKPRIVIFVGSPVEYEEKVLNKLGKILRKNKIALDVIGFGHPENGPLLQALVDGANNQNNSHYLDIPNDMDNIAGLLISSPIMTDLDDQIPQAAAGEGGDAPAGVPDNSRPSIAGVDPTTDPELYQALLISMEEAKNEQQQEQQPVNQNEEVAAPAQPEAAEAV